MHLRLLLALSLFWASVSSAEPYDPQMMDYLNQQLNGIQAAGPTYNAGSGLTQEQAAALNRGDLGVSYGDKGNRFTGETANGLSAGVLNGKLMDASGINYDLDNNMKGREIKADNSAASSGAGQAAAIATGTVLTSTGTAMLQRGLALLNPPLIAAGADLIAKGAQEFAQAGADSGAKGANEAQRDLLMDDSNQKGSQFVADQAAAARAATVNDIKAKLDTPEMREMLGNQGVNSDDFLDRLARGGFGSTADVLNGIGFKDSLSADDLAKANALAAQSLKDAGLGFDESKTSLNGNGIATTAGSGAAGTPSNANPHSGNPAALAAAAAAGGSAGGSGASGKNPGEPGAGAGGFMPDWAKNMLGQVAPGAQSLAALNSQQLQALGLAKLVKGQNLFQRVHRTYRKFGDWRKGQGRLASND